MVKILVLEETPLGKKVLEHYTEEDIVRYKMTRFKDGELFIELEEPVRGDDVMVIGSICEPVNENLVKFLICIDTLKRSSAKSINLIIPYLGYSRQDRKTKPWQPISAKLIADLLQTAGATRLTTCDLHARQIEGFYDIQIDNIPIQLILGNRWNKMTRNYPEFNTDDYVVVSPDHGGVTRAREFMLQSGIKNLVIINKIREKANKVESMQVLGDAKGKSAIIIDDLVDTGGTLIRASTELKKQGAKAVYIYCTHGVLSADAIEKLSACEAIDKLFITNTIDKSDKLINDRISYVDISDIINGIIDAFTKSKDIYNYIMEEILH